MPTQLAASCSNERPCRSAHTSRHERSLEFDLPAYLVLSWAWINNGPDSENPLEGATPFLAEPTVLRFDLTEDTAADGGKQTTVEVRHGGLPVEWLDDMTTYWNWIFALAEAKGLGLN